MSAPSADDIQLFVRLARRDHEGAARLLRQRQAPLDAFVDAAAAHGLSVVVLDALEKSPLRSAFAPALLERMEERRRQQATRSRRLLEALEALAARFSAAGQRFMLLKGPYLASRFYGDRDGREFVDLDVLVPHADRANAFELLAAEGYEPRSHVVLSPRLTCFFVHGFDFSNGSVQVDLHWRLSRHPSLQLDEARIWQRRQSYELGAARYDVLADEDEIVFAVLSLLRDLERGGPKIKNVVDLLRIVEAVDGQIDWQSFLAVRRAEGTFGPLVNVLGLCLDAADAHAVAPRLSAALASHSRRRVHARRSEFPLVFRPMAMGLGNKLWCAGVHDTPLMAWLLWWSISLPFRVAVHRRAKGRPKTGGGRVRRP